jgi:hypothetical protein
LIGRKRCRNNRCPCFSYPARFFRHLLILTSCFNGPLSYLTGHNLVILETTYGEVLHSMRMARISASLIVA